MKTRIATCLISILILYVNKVKSLYKGYQTVHTSWSLGMVVQGQTKNHQNATRQDLKNGLSSYYGGYEIDPYCNDGGASESDFAGSTDRGGGEAGTL
jgi:hypothetical protein